MSNIIPNSNLPAPSQPWGREIQKRLQSLESEVARQKINSNSADAQLQSSYRRIDKTLDGLFGLGTAGSPYQINASNINAGTLNASVVSVTNLNASNLTSGTIASGRITTDSISAANVNADRINAGTLNGNIVSVTNLNAGNITSGTIASGRITTASISAADVNADRITSGTISSGRITTDSISAANVNADRINAGTLNGNVVSVTNLNAGNITSGTISSDRITTDSISAANVNADRINAGTLTGRTVRTASSGKRAVLSQPSNSLTFFDANGTQVGSVEGLTTAGGSLGISGRGTAGINIGQVSTVFTGNVSTSGTADITAAGRAGQVTFTTIGTTTSAVHRAGSGGSIYMFGPSGSDVRLKEDIVELENSLELINNMRPVKFRFKAEQNGPTSYGLIAQEVQPFFDDNDNVVNTFDADESGEKYLSIEYNAFIAPLIGAVKELTQKNLDLEARIAILEGRV
jgi:hypothetical protein